MNLDLMGGISINISEMKSEQDLRRVMDLLQTAISPLQPVLKIIDVIMAIKNVLDKATDIPTSPSNFTDALKDLTKKIVDLLPLLPQLSIPVMIKSLCKLADQVIDRIIKQLESVTYLQDNIDILEQVENLDPVLSAIKQDIQEQKDEQIQELQKYLEIFQNFLKILKIMGKIININIDFDLNIGGELQPIIDELTRLRQILHTIVVALGG